MQHGLLRASYEPSFTEISANPINHDNQPAQFQTAREAEGRLPLTPHRGISQEKPPLYFGFFQFVQDARRRGKALLGTLIAGLVA